MSVSGFLTIGCLVFATFYILHTAQSSPQHFRQRSESSFSKDVGVLVNVDEDSCSCKTLFQPCQVRILDEMVKMKRGSPCPPFTWYCCQRETIQPLDPSNTTTTESSSADLATNETVHPTTSSVVDKSSKQPSGCSNQMSNRKDMDCSTGVKSKVFPQNSTKEMAQNTSISAPAKPTTTNIFKPESPLKEKVSPRRPKMIACSCTSKEDCTSSWALIGNLPDVLIKTTLTCEDSIEVICCLGQVLPPRAMKSVNPETTTKINTDTTTTKNLETTTKLNTDTTTTKNFETTTKINTDTTTKNLETTTKITTDTTTTTWNPAIFYSWLLKQ